MDSEVSSFLNLQASEKPTETFQLILQKFLLRFLQEKLQELNM